MGPADCYVQNCRGVLSIADVAQRAAYRGLVLRVLARFFPGRLTPYSCSWKVLVPLWYHIRSGLGCWLLKVFGQALRASVVMRKLLPNANVRRLNMSIKFQVEMATDLLRLGGWALSLRPCFACRGLDLSLQLPV